MYESVPGRAFFVRRLRPELYRKYWILMWCQSIMQKKGVVEWSILLLCCPHRVLGIHRLCQHNLVCVGVSWPLSVCVCVSGFLRPELNRESERSAVVQWVRPGRHSCPETEHPGMRRTPWSTGRQLPYTPYITRPSFLGQNISRGQNIQ